MRSSYCSLCQINQKKKKHPLAACFKKEGVRDESGRARKHALFHFELRRNGAAVVLSDICDAIATTEAAVRPTPHHQHFLLLLVVFLALMLLFIHLNVMHRARYLSALLCLLWSASNNAAHSSCHLCVAFSSSDSALWSSCWAKSSLLTAMLLL